MAMRTRKPRRKPCPYCGSGDTGEIWYGLITGFSGDFVPGGCMVTDSQPSRSCRTCGRAFEYPGNLFDGPRSTDPDWGIDFVREIDGHDVYRQREVRWGGLVSVDEVLTPGSTDTAWIARVVTLVKRAKTDLIRTRAANGDVFLRERLGPLVVHIVSNGASVKLHEVPIEDQSQVFAGLWGVTTALVTQVGCAAFAQSSIFRSTPNLGSGSGTKALLGLALIDQGHGCTEVSPYSCPSPVALALVTVRCAIGERGRLSKTLTYCVS